MSAASALHHHQTSLNNDRMSGPLVVSVLFHVGVAILCFVGLPYIRSTPPELSDPIPVELVKLDDISRVDKMPAKADVSRPVPEKEKEPDKEPPKPQAPTVTSVTPPKLTPPKPPEPKKADPKPVEKPPEPVVAEKAEPPKDMPKPVQKPVLTKTEEKPAEDFQSVLRNLMPAEPTPAQASNAPQPGAEPSPLAQFSQQMTMSEADALRRQLGQCWNMMAGARFAEDLAVDIKLFMNPDRTVRDAQVLDQFRYFRDDYFRAAADSALRAVRNPHCNPLDLPPQKYELWKVITVTFDPKDML